MESTIRILMLEDSENDANFYEKSLQNSGLKIHLSRVTTLEGFWIALNEVKPQIVLSDLFLNNISIEDIISIIRELKRSIPVIVLNKTHFRNHEPELRNAGVSAYLTENDLDKLSNTIKTVLDSASKGKTKDQIWGKADFDSDRKDGQWAEHYANDFKTLIENSPDIIIRYSPGLKPLYVNPAWEKISGVSSVKFLEGKEKIDIPLHIMAYWIRLLKKVRSTGMELQGECELPGTQPKYFQARVVPEKDQTGKLISILVIGRDMTYRKHLEEQLKYLAQFEKLISTFATNLIDADIGKIDTIITNSLRLLAKYLNADRAFITSFSNKAEFDYAYQWLSPNINRYRLQNRWNNPADFPWFYSQLTDFSIIYLSSSDPLPQTALKENAWLKQSQIISLLYIPLVFQGSVIGFLGFECFRATKQELTEEFKKVLRISAAIFVNTLNRKRKEHELNQSENNYRAIFENTGTAMIIIEQDSLITIANSEFSGLIGYSKSEIESKMHVEEFFSPDDVAVVSNFQNYFYKNQTVSNKYELRIIDKQKKLKNVILHIANIPKTSRKIVSFIDITDRVHAEQRLRDLDSSKSEFVSMASHEMRTPLTGIIGLTQTLLAKDIELTEEERERFLQIIESEGNRLSSLLSELLDLTKIETGTTEFNPVEIDIKELINETIRVLPLPSTIHLNIEIPSDHAVYAKADRDRIKQVLVNLLENAVRYSKESGTIVISVQEREHNITIDISDTGAGIKKEDIPRIFEKFFRSKTARKIASKGTGLGLTISKNIIEANGGKIWVKSQEGEGTTFTFTLPKSENCSDEQ